jgi:hypothetical protein
MGNNNILGRTDEAGNLKRDLGKPHVLNVGSTVRYKKAPISMVLGA